MKDQLIRIHFFLLMFLAGYANMASCQIEDELMDVLRKMEGADSTKMKEFKFLNRMVV